MSEDTERKEGEEKEIDLRVTIPFEEYQQLCAIRDMFKELVENNRKMIEGYYQDRIKHLESIVYRR